MNVIVCPSSPLLDADLKILEQFYGYIVKPFVDMQAKPAAPELPDHLGGSWGKHNIDHGALDYINNFGDTMLDIGCGTGGTLEYAHDTFGMDGLGIDGDPSITRRAPVIVHDYTKGSLDIDNKDFDIAWSVEFLEHVEEKYIANYMATFRRCKYALVTFAPPDTPGHHHVNCRTEDYWIAQFKKYGFDFDADHTGHIRKASTMGRDFMRDNGLFFTRQNE